MTPTSAARDVRGLAAVLSARDPRVVIVTAPPGYGKTTLVREFAQIVGRLVECPLPATAEPFELVRAVVDATIGDDRVRIERLAADRLAQHRGATGSTARETLLREWTAGTDSELFALRDPSGMLATPAGAELMSELLANLPPSRTLAIVSREALPPAVAQLVRGLQPLEVGCGELALDLDETAALAERSGVPPAAVRPIFDLCRGWPLVTELMMGLVRREGIDALLEATEPVPYGALFAFAGHRTVAALSESVRNALIVAMLLPWTGYVTLVRVLGDECDDAVFARLRSLPFIETAADGSAVRVHPEVRELVRVRFEPAVRTLYERTIEALTGDGEYTTAAGIALDAGDVIRAAATVDAAPPYTASAASIADYERVIDQIDRSLITRYPNLWIATIPFRSFAVDPATYVREAETVYFCLPPGASADQRAAVVMLLSSAYVNVGRLDDSEQVIAEALNGFASTKDAARAGILNFLAALRGIEGRFRTARELAAEAATITRDAFGENQTLHYIEAHEAAYRGKQDRVVVIIDELLRRRAREQLPLYTAYAAMNGAIFSWVNGDDASFERYVSALEASSTPGLEAGLAPIIEAARGRPIRVDDDYPWPVISAMAHLYRIGEAESDEDAVAAARAAAQAANRRKDPYTRLLAGTALFVLDESSRAEQAAALKALIAAFESPEMAEAVNGVIEGTGAGMLTHFVERRVLRSNGRHETKLTVELLGGRVVRDGSPVRLTDKEFEFLALLASSRTALSRNRIGEALWDHLDPEEWPNNLKVTLHRVRSKLGSKDVVLNEDGLFRLAPRIEVDVRRIETCVRGARGRPLDDAISSELANVIAAYRSGASPRFDRFAWAGPLAMRLDDLVVTVAEALAADACARGRSDEAIGYAAVMEAIDALSERACELTIHAFLRAEDVDGARRALRRYSAVLAQELGAKPSAALTELLRAHP